MIVVYLETEKAEKGFDLIQAWQNVDTGKQTELVHPYETDDRLLAAIVNLGFACRGISDKEYVRAFVDLKSDLDGRDYRYNKEHDTLYHLLFPSNTNESRKVLSLYGNYLKYLRRIQQLVISWKITIQLEGK